MPEIAENDKADYLAFADEFMTFRKRILDTCVEQKTVIVDDMQIVALYDQLTRIRNTDTIRGPKTPPAQEGQPAKREPEEPITEKQLKYIYGSKKFKRGSADKVNGYLKSMEIEKVEKLTKNQAKGLIDEISRLEDA